MLHLRSHLRLFLPTCRRVTRNPTSQRTLLTLAIETSCDDTCVAILSKSSAKQGSTTDLLFNEQTTLENSGKGGVVPTEALAGHESKLSALLERALQFLPEPEDGSRLTKKIWLRDGTPKQKPDFVSVTRGPGMSANLGVGLLTAKGMATAWQIPMVGVHHMQAHALTPRLVTAMSKPESDTRVSHQPAFPFLTLLVSGGHTMLLYSKGLVDHEILVTTTDTAIGDELDKCGRLILPAKLREGTPDTSYAKYLSAYAFPMPEQYATCRVPRTRGEEVHKPPNAYNWKIITPLADTRSLRFSFAGIHSSVKRLMKAREDAGGISAQERLLLARSTLEAAFEHLGSRTVLALEQLRSEKTEISTLVVGGGVAANEFLRFYLRKFLDVRGFENVRLVFPPVKFCTDNAAMIGWAGLEMFEAGYTTDLGVAPLRKWSMDSTGLDGGIMGLNGWVKRDGC